MLVGRAIEVSEVVVVGPATLRLDVATVDRSRYSVEMTLPYWSTQMTALGAVIVTTSVMVE